MLAFLNETLEHEVEHRDLFFNSMSSRNASPCKAIWAWSVGGWILGAITALMGKNMIWICTEAVEETVHQHLEDQLHFLETLDAELYEAIASIKEEEFNHLMHAKQRISSRNLVSNVVSGTIKILTELVIWLSTQGDSTRMATVISAKKG